MSKFEFKEDLRYLRQHVKYKEDEVFDLIYQGDIINVKQKIKNGLSINLRNDKDQTLLHYAVLYRQVEIAKFLILSGACIDTKDKSGQNVKEVISEYYPNLINLNTLNNLENEDQKYESFFNQELIGENKCEICIIF